MKEGKGKERGVDFYSMSEDRHFMEHRLPHA
jgi:hypothetical protein